MAKPTEYLDWNPSQSGVIEPSSGLKASGVIPGMGWAAQYENWALNLIDQWIQYFDGVTSFTQITVSTTTVLTTAVRTCFANPGGGSFTVAVPASVAGTQGNRYTIKNINFVSANTVTVIPTGGDTLEGQASIPLGAGEYITLEDNGAGAFYQVG